MTSAARVGGHPCLEHDGNDGLGRFAHWVRRYPHMRGRLLASCRRPARAMLYLTAMSKPTRSKAPRRGTTDRSATTDVVTQLECAVKNPHAALIGAVIGGLVPWFGRTLAHAEIPSAWAAGSTGLAMAMIAVVIGCGLFSGLSVYKFGRAAFGDPRKALGFVLALEGVMLVSHGATSHVALAVLILINAVANGSVIALARDAARRRCEVDVRRAATRARRHPNSPAARVPAAASPWNRLVDAAGTAIDAEVVSEELYS